MQDTLVGLKAQVFAHLCQQQLLPYQIAVAHIVGSHQGPQRCRLTVQMPIPQGFVVFDGMAVCGQQSRMAMPFLQVTRAAQHDGDAV